MGLPLDFGDECPPGFLTQVGKTASPQGEISTVYCVLSAKGLRNTEKGRFRSFCMFLLNQNRETCPKGESQILTSQKSVLVKITRVLAAFFQLVLNRGVLTSK